MAIFESLPTTNTCCFCLNVKLGCILIALHGILFAGYAAGPIMSPVCEGEGALATVTKIFTFLLVASEALVFIASIIFLIGIFINKSITATIYLYAMALFLVASLLFFVVTTIAVTTDGENCKAAPGLFTHIIGFLITFYFMIVVRTFRGDMSD